ncbi:MAG: DMT family transporter [Clostridia bacterium]|jgi:drug/metabolite transporter (DMT)-like permease
MIVLKEKESKASILLLLAAFIWGFAFVAQRVGIKYIGSFTFNGVRFALGSISLIPLILYSQRMNKKTSRMDIVQGEKAKALTPVGEGIICGLVLFMGATLQQIGLEDTTAGKAAFITGFYIVLVPLLGRFLGQRIKKNTWIAAIFAITGLYLISVTDRFTISRGDMLVFLGSFFWAAHILLIDRFTQRTDALVLSFIQYIVCSVLSLLMAVAFEEISLQGLVQAQVPILYGGIASVGIAYTLQAYGQKHAKPSHAAIILSLEAVFAAIGGFLLLNETMNMKAFIGCALMFIGVLVSQMDSFQEFEVQKYSS